MLYHVLSDGDSPLLKIDNIGFSADPRITRFGPGQRDMFLMHYVLGGKGTFNGRSVTVGEGFLIAPGDPECYSPDDAAPWTFLWVTSHDPQIAALFSALGADDSNIFRADAVAAAQSLTKWIALHHNVFLERAVILEHFLHLFNQMNRKADASPDSARTYFSHADSYIRDHLFRRITVTELTQVIGVSQPYLYRIFREAVNCSPKQYIDEVRLTRAKELLQLENMRISDIANSLGFSDAFAFSDFFLKRTGVRPSAYRDR